jgi:hypothetical protein
VAWLLGYEMQKQKPQFSTREHASAATAAAPSSPPAERSITAEWARIVKGIAKAPAHHCHHLDCSASM